ncbi:UNVERIFIED_CONTAM: hypothetical protein Scaly_1979500 [Sesamum calycinum]|uniref:Transmembrane protein n=1 Tax=Sesamum calycinum TaxID=2727403 RepID=A0AAW2N270_9LAMI
MDRVNSIFSDVSSLKEESKTEMVLWPYSPTPKQLTLHICGFLTAAIFIAVGTHLSFSNIAPQQARAQARKDFLKARLRKLLED